jgi:EAL domain-containing protein (putative c-di-GMP-specific phosphodiesterase class I)
VNVSACQFRSQSIQAAIAGILAETGVHPSSLEVELTESAIMHNVEDAMATLAALKSMGIAISIDDFGTGYSSLGYLKRFTIDRIKIDRSFVKNVLDNRDDNVIVIAIIAMARSLNLKVIAEGVETEEQAAFLERQGCHEIQGYLCGRPVPPEQLIPFLKERDWRKVVSTPGLSELTTSGQI